MHACVYCGEHVRPDAPGIIREVTGWVRDRSAGGVNHLIERKETGRLAHYSCAIGDQPEQEGLF